MKGGASPYIEFLKQVSTKGMSKDERTKAYKEWKDQNIPKLTDYKEKYEDCEDKKNTAKKRVRKYQRKSKKCMSELDDASNSVNSLEEQIKELMMKYQNEQEKCKKDKESQQKQLSISKKKHEQERMILNKEIEDLNKKAKILREKYFALQPKPVKLSSPEISMIPKQIQEELVKRKKN